MRKLTALLASIAALASAALIGAPARAGSPYTIAAAGDIACNSDPYPNSQPDECQYDNTARLLEPTVPLLKVLTLGDNQYEHGDYSDYLAYYDRYWGTVKSNTSPVPGNHEYSNDPNSTPQGYFDYFGSAVQGPGGLGYYSYDLGACPQAPCWHFIALNSELCFSTMGCGPGSPEYEWLKSDLAAHPNRTYPCTLAYWHHPLFSFSTISGASNEVKPFWDLLYAAHADVVLNGHSHNYERWRPQNPNGNADVANGIREFIVGTGGKSKYPLQAGIWPTNLIAAQDTTFGVLRITLRPTSYNFEFRSATRQPVTYYDARTGVSCV